MNPNPGRIFVHRGGQIQDVLETHDQLITPLTESLKVSYEGKAALVLFEIRADDPMESHEPWLQTVRGQPTRPDPEKADRHAALPS